MEEANTPGERLAAESLISTVRDGFKAFTSRASAADIFVLSQALHHADSNGTGSLVETFLSEVGVELPNQEQNGDGNG
ncbi:MAG: hypothetical protein M3Y72_01660 [Acidobacteriota bacterium]|nr:hypothetical protein [Acidobacteriota bacterium]